MRTIAVVFLIGFLSCKMLFSQENVLRKDSLNFFHKTGGDIDTFDLSFSFPLSSVPGGSLSKYNSTTTVDFFRKSPYLIQNFLPEIPKNQLFTGLPHLGFYYSFGIKSTQFLHAEYQQNFKNKSSLNLNINRQSSAFDTNEIFARGISRNGGFAKQNFDFSYQIPVKRLLISVRSAYMQNKLMQNGGIVMDSVTDEKLNFAKVKKENAFSIQKSAIADVNFRFHLSRDSSFIRYGLFSQHNYEILNRKYIEKNDTLSKIYSVINYDSTTTRDQFQDAKIKNGLGFFIGSKFFDFSAALDYRYWRFQNLGNNLDTNEVSLSSRFEFFKNNWIAFSQNYINVLGAKNEYYSRSSVKYLQQNFEIAAHFATESMLPLPVQRSYFANWTNYSTPLEKQQRTDIFLRSKFRFQKIEVEALAGALVWKNNLQWLDTKWIKGSQSNLSVYYLKAKMHLNLKWFHFYPELLLNQGSEFLPKAILTSRIAVKTKVFKAKKLEMLFALDPQLTDKYKFMAYNPMLDNWYFDPSSRSGGQILTLHGTVSMAIEEFRFFVKVENIQSFWTPTNTEIQQNYYRSPFLFRLGISWDFFN